MTPKGTIQQIETNLLLGIQFDEFDFRLFLREYHRSLRNRFPSEDIPDFEPSLVLDTLIARHEEHCDDGRAGRRYEALRAYAHRAHRLDLALTGSDYGQLEQRDEPYNFDRFFYHVGRKLVTAGVRMEYPGYNPYRSTRQLSISFVRENLDDLLELVPDYLWWAMHDQRELMARMLDPEKIDEIRRQIELAGFKLDNFGLYLTTQEYIFLPGELEDEANASAKRATAPDKSSQVG